VRLGQTKRFNWHWIPCIAVVGVIFWLSSQPYEKQSIKSELKVVVDKLQLDTRIPHISFRFGDTMVDTSRGGTEGILEFFLRKLAHFVEYLLLTVVFMRAVRYTSKWSLAKTGCWVAAGCILYAVSDEMHQHFTQQRNPTWEDVLIDAMGVIAGWTLYSIVSRKSRKYRGDSKKAGLPVS
jgi:VanZ family protein